MNQPCCSSTNQETFMVICLLLDNYSSFSELSPLFSPIPGETSEVIWFILNNYFIIFVSEVKHFCQFQGSEQWLARSK